MLCTLPMFALATAYRRQCEWEAWRGTGRLATLPTLTPRANPEPVLVCAHGYDDSFHLAAFALLMGASSRMCH